jgi:hypothetical protein
MSQAIVTNSTPDAGAVSRGAALCHSWQRLACYAGRAGCGSARGQWFHDPDRRAFQTWRVCLASAAPPSGAFCAGHAALF